MRKLFRYLVVACTWAMAGHAAGQPLRIETIEGPPWGYLGSDGKPTGMMYEIGNRIAEEAGLPHTNTLVPYARTALQLEAGSADLILRFGNEHVRRVADPVAVVVKMPIILVGPSGTRYTDLNDLHGKTVGVVRTSSYVQQFDLDTAIAKYPVNDYVMMARMVAMRRLDAGIGSSVGLCYGLYMAGVRPGQLGAPLVLGSNDFVLFMSKKTTQPGAVKALQQAVAKLVASGEVAQIMEKYTRVFAASGAFCSARPGERQP